MLAMHAGIDQHALSRIRLDQVSDDRNVDPHAAIATGRQHHPFVDIAMSEIE